MNNLAAAADSSLECNGANNAEADEKAAEKVVSLHRSLKLGGY
jgi:hypothetical protein